LLANHINSVEGANLFLDNRGVALGLYQIISFIIHIPRLLSAIPIEG